MVSLNLQIKDMVCPRCILVVEKELTDLGATVLNIELGHVTITYSNDLSIEQIGNKLREFGLELIENKEEMIAEQIKINVRNFIKKIESTQEQITLSEFLSKEIGKNYNLLSKLFSKKESQTIESFYIEKRIERVKELLKYDEFNLSEISVKLGYSSVHYLSSQFKKVTGISVSDFKVEIKQLLHKYSSISEALNDLKDQGFKYDFSRDEDVFLCNELDKPFPFESLNITEVYRFKEATSKKGKSAVFSVDTGNGVKGLLVESNVA